MRLEAGVEKVTMSKSLPFIASVFLSVKQEVGVECLSFAVLLVFNELTHKVGSRLPFPGPEGGIRG